MKKSISNRLAVYFAALLIIGATACNRSPYRASYRPEKRPAYCPANANVHVKADKKGKLPIKPAKSGLFPKNMKH